MNDRAWPGSRASLPHSLRNDSIVATKILDDEPSQVGVLPCLVEYLANVVPAGLAFRMPKDIRASWKLRHFLNPPDRFICKRHESGFAKGPCLIIAGVSGGLLLSPSQRSICECIKSF